MKLWKQKTYLKLSENSFTLEQYVPIDAQFAKITHITFWYSEAEQIYKIKTSMSDLYVTNNETRLEFINKLEECVLKQNNKFILLDDQTIVIEFKKPSTTILEEVFKLIHMVEQIDEDSMKEMIAELQSLSGYPVVSDLQSYASMQSEKGKETKPPVTDQQEFENKLKDKGKGKATKGSNSSLEYYSPVTDEEQLSLALQLSLESYQRETNKEASISSSSSNLNVNSNQASSSVSTSQTTTFADEKIDEELARALKLSMECDQSEINTEVQGTTLASSNSGNLALFSNILDSPRKKIYSEDGSLSAWVRELQQKSTYTPSNLDNVVLVPTDGSNKIDEFEMIEQAHGVEDDLTFYNYNEQQALEAAIAASLELKSAAVKQEVVSPISMFQPSTANSNSQVNQNANVQEETNSLDKNCLVRK